MFTGFRDNLKPIICGLHNLNNTIRQMLRNLVGQLSCNLIHTASKGIELCSRRFAPATPSTSLLTHFHTRNTNTVQSPAEPDDRKRFLQVFVLQTRKLIGHQTERDISDPSGRTAFCEARDQP
jgi:hypothetical protein